MTSNVASGHGHLLSAKEMKSGVRAFFMERLEPLEFKGSGTTWIRKRCPNAYDRVAISWLTYGKDADFFAAEIHVGIHSEPIERVFAALDGDSYSRHSKSPTLQRLLGYEMPQQRPDKWVLSRREFPAQVVREMVEATVSYGLPFIAKFSTWETIYAGVARYGGDKATRLPIIRYLMGESKAAIELVQNELKKIEGRTYPAADVYRKRAAALIDLCKHGRLR